MLRIAQKSYQLLRKWSKFKNRFKHLFTTKIISFSQQSFSPNQSLTDLHTNSKKTICVITTRNIRVFLQWIFCLNRGKKGLRRIYTIFQVKGEFLAEVRQTNFFSTKSLDRTGCLEAVSQICSIKKMLLISFWEWDVLWQRLSLPNDDKRNSNYFQKDKLCRTKSRHEFKDTREKAPSNKTSTVSKSMNMNIWVVGTSDQFFIRGS